jgi:hypothetical protein
VWSIRQVSENEWEVLDASGNRVGELHTTYALALAVIADALQSQLAAAEGDGTNDPEDGLLPDVWEDAGGIAFSQATGDGRDFSDCQWSWRDPNVSLLPVMLQTETEIAHFGATLAGFVAELHMNGTNVGASGRFYATERGREARDYLLGGRRFGVSVDPGAVDLDWICVEEDEDGWCVADELIFHAYQIIGLTMTPFPGFEAAAIQLRAGAESTDSTDSGDGEDAAQSARQPALAAAASTMLSFPIAPPASWFEIPEPQAGQTGMLDVYGMPVEELLIEQPNGGLAVPLTILDDGRVFGHVAQWEQPHVGYVNARRQVTAPDSRAAYAHFHVGSCVLDDRSRLAVGNAVFGCEHAPLREADGSVVSAATARDYYAHSGAGWAQLRVTSGEHGAWACGALRPDLSELQLRILRSLTLSGDWRELGGGLELIGVLAVNVPGFPIAREALAASGVELLPEVTAISSLSSPRGRCAAASSVSVELRSRPARAPRALTQHVARAAQMTAGSPGSSGRCRSSNVAPDRLWRALGRLSSTRSARTDRSGSYPPGSKVRAARRSRDARAEHLVHVVAPPSDRDPFRSPVEAHNGRAASASGAVPAGHHRSVRRRAGRAAGADPRRGRRGARRQPDRRAARHPRAGS